MAQEKDKRDVNQSRLEGKGGMHERYIRKVINQSTNRGINVRHEGVEEMKIKQYATHVRGTPTNRLKGRKPKEE